MNVCEAGISCWSVLCCQFINGEPGQSDGQDQVGVGSSQFRKKEEKRKREEQTFVLPPTPPWKMSRNRDTGCTRDSGVGVCAG